MGFEFKNLFGGNRETSRTQEEAEGRTAEGAVGDISTAYEPNAPKNTFSREGAINMERLELNPTELQNNVERIVVDSGVASEDIIGHEKTLYVPALMKMGIIPETYAVDEDLLKQVRTAATAVAKKRLSAEAAQRKAGGPFPADYLQKEQQM